MKKILMVLLLLIFTTFTYSQGLAFSAMSGNSSLDLTLENLNVEARENPSNFTSSLNFSYGVPKKTITKMIVEDRIEPADVYMIFEIASIQKQPVEYVESVYWKHRGKGWVRITKEMGMRNDSYEYRSLKNNVGKAKHHKDEKWEKKRKYKHKNKHRDYDDYDND